MSTLKKIEKNDIICKKLKGTYAMESDQIEEMAVTLIEKEILKYSNLKPNIPKGDKAISWDGYITVFDGKGRNKEHFEYNINVQLKRQKS